MRTIQNGEIPNDSHELKGYWRYCLLHSRTVCMREYYCVDERIELLNMKVKFSAAKLQKFFVIRKQIWKNLQKHFCSIQLKDEIDANGANLPRSENLELLRSLVEIVSERDRIMQFKDGTGLSPTLQVHGFRGFKNTTCCRDMDGVHDCVRSDERG